MSLGSGRFVALFAALRQPADLASEAGRAHARNRAIAFTALASAFARGVSILTALVSVPLTLHYLGTERYGMWMTLSAFSALLSFTDFGIGNSVLTAVARSAGGGDPAELRRQISSAYGAMCGIATAMLALLALAYPFVPWDRLFNVTSARAAAEAGPAAAMFFVILALTTPLGLVTRIQMGLQEGFRANLWQGAASVAALGALVVATRLEASLPWLVLALAGTPLLVSLVNMIHFFGRVRPGLRPQVRHFSTHAIRRLSVDGGMFLILQVCAALMFQINALIIAQVLGAKAVAVYAVPDRMFSVISMVLAFVLAPLWPAYGEAVARGDIAWVRSTLRRSLVYGAGGAVAMSILLILAGQQLLHWWVGDAVAVPFLLILGMGIWKVIDAIANSVAVFLNGVNEIRIQVVLALISVVASLLLKVWWLELFGIAGVVFAMIATYCILMLPFLTTACSRALAAISARGVQGVR